MFELASDHSWSLPDALKKFPQGGDGKSPPAPRAEGKTGKGGGRKRTFQEERLTPPLPRRQPKARRRRKPRLLRTRLRRAGKPRGASRSGTRRHA